jgi:hypothetical protein
MLIDSNIIIYATKPEHGSIRQFISEHSPSVSAVSYVEVLGYHKLADQERTLLISILCDGIGPGCIPASLGSGSETPPTTKNAFGRCAGCRYSISS